MAVRKFAVFMALAGLFAFTSLASGGGVREVCEETFFDEVVGYGKPVIVEFYAPTCPVCKKMAPVVEGLAADLGGNVKVVKVNTRENRKLSEQFEIRNIPTFMLFDGGNVMRTHVGGSSRDGLKKRLGLKQTDISIPAPAVLTTINAVPCIAGIEDVNDSTFWKEVMLAGDMVVVEFWEEDNPDCRRMDELFTCIAAEPYQETKFVKMNVKASSKTANKYGVEDLPAYFSFTIGNVIGRATGVMSKEELKEKLGL